MGKIAGWAAGRGFSNLIVVNENTKKPSALKSCNSLFSVLMVLTDAITLVHLPDGPTAYFKLTSIQLTKKIFVRCFALRKAFYFNCESFEQGRARATPHNPELVLNNFVTRLGHTVGRMFQTFFPPLPEFQGRQVVTLHNQRDFLFFRRHR